MKWASVALRSGLPSELCLGREHGYSRRMLPIACAGWAAPAARWEPTSILRCFLFCCRAAAKAGRSVLQLDPSDSYGGSWASLHLAELQQLLLEGGGGSCGGSSAQETATAADGTVAEPGDYPSPGQQQQPAASAVAAGISGAAVWQQAGASLGPSSHYSLDLAPKVG